MHLASPRAPGLPPSAHQCGEFLKDHSKLRSLLRQLPRLHRHLKILNTEGAFINQHKPTHLKRAVLATAHSRPTTSTAVTLRVLRASAVKPSRLQKNAST